MTKLYIIYCNFELATHYVVLVANTAGYIKYQNKLWKVGDCLLKLRTLLALFIFSTKQESKYCSLNCQIIVNKNSHDKFLLASLLQKCSFPQLAIMKLLLCFSFILLDLSLFLQVTSCYGLLPTTAMQV